MIFSDWRKADISEVLMALDNDYVYFLHSRAWGLKGYLGGTHSWLAFWCHENKKWMVAEVSDRETVDVQGARTYCAGTEHYSDKTPILSDRSPRQKWFNAYPSIVAKERRRITIQQASAVIRSYPFSQYKLLHRNCNTFFSYLVYELDLHFQKPLVSVGFRPKKFWRKWSQQKSEVAMARSEAYL